MGIWPWVGFILFVLAMLALDLGIAHRRKRAMDFKQAITWSIFWIGLSFLFAVLLYHWRGPDQALLYVTGYLIEWSLSVDNLFVFLLIFGYFKVNHQNQHRVLFWGIVGALVMRALFIFAGIALIERFHWVIYVFGIFLIYTAIRLAFRKDEEMDPGHSPVLRLARRFLPVAQEDHPSGHFFARTHGRLLVRPLFVVLLMVETTDLIFAVDSIPAILAITHDRFIVYTSNIFAILGLRSMFFVLAGFMGLFRFLNYGLVFILGFVGVKMLLPERWQLAPQWSLMVVVGCLLASILLSLLIPERKEKTN